MKPIKRHTYGDTISVFFIGFFICLFILFSLQDNFERDFFENISREISSKRQIFNEDSSIVDALHVTYKLLSGRSAALAPGNHFGFDIYEGSLTDDLMTAKGACGSYAVVLANLLKTMGHKTRIAQMKVNDRYGGHIITEVSTKNGWVALDGAYDLFFITPSGKIASFADVGSNWGYYKFQTPVGYNMDYRYAGVRYANWDKIPVLMPLIKKCFTLLVGEERMANLSIRPFFLRKYSLYCVLLIPVILFLTAWVMLGKIRVFRLRKNRSTPEARSHRLKGFIVDIFAGTGLVSLFVNLRIFSRGKRRFYENFVREVELQAFVECRNNFDVNAQKTDCAISVFNLPFNSVVRLLIRQLGLPSCHIRRYCGAIHHDIYFYSIYIYKRRSVIQFHYFDKKYFLCNITFSANDHEQNDDVLKILAQKYAVGTGRDDKKILIDRESNYLLFDSSFNLNISYMSNDMEIVRALLDGLKGVPKPVFSNYRLSNFNLPEIL
jgi:hypothetical protein